jgi:hypothetical protein
VLAAQGYFRQSRHWLTARRFSLLLVSPTNNNKALITVLSYKVDAETCIVQGGYKANKQEMSLIIMTLTNKQNLHWCTLSGMHLYIYIYIYCIINIRVLAGGRNTWCNHGSRRISVHPKEQHTGSKDSRFDCFNYHATLQVGVVAVTNNP